MKPITYGQRLQELRLKAGLSQSQLADKMDMSAWTLRTHEQDARMPAADVLMAYCKALGVSCQEFHNCISPPKRSQKPKKKKS